ncbi:MAG: hypothetical protein AB8B49_01765, partial [Nitratireductor sp.]
MTQIQTYSTRTSAAPTQMPRLNQLPGDVLAQILDHACDSGNDVRSLIYIKQTCRDLRVASEPFENKALEKVKPIIDNINQKISKERRLDELGLTQLEQGSWDERTLDYITSLMEMIANNKPINHHEYLQHPHRSEALWLMDSISLLSGQNSQANFSSLLFPEYQDMLQTSALPEAQGKKILGMMSRYNVGPKE